MARGKVIDVPDGMKYCPKCGEVKPLSEFSTYTRKSTGKVAVQSRCKACQRRNVKSQPKSTETTKFCARCGDWLDKSMFYSYTRKNSDRVEYSAYCIVCTAELKKNLDEEDRIALNFIHRKSDRSRRRNPDYVAYYILRDSRYQDKSKGRENDLDEKFIAEMISHGCSYCGATSDEVRIGLDRINNSLGHLKSNVVPACIRCNNTRRDMPIEAWLIVAEGMRKAREQGKFGNWDGCTKRGRKQDFSHERQDEV